MTSEGHAPQFRAAGTERLAAAIVLVAVGGLLALLGGRADAALLVTPWCVLLIAGASRTQRPELIASILVSPRRVMAGDDVELSTRFEGAGIRKGAWLSVTARADEAFAAPPETDPSDGRPLRETLTVSVPFGATGARTNHALTTSQWGRADVGPSRATVHDPFGLIRWEAELDDSLRVQVHPEPPVLRGLLAPWRVRRLVGSHASRTVGAGVEYADLRPYSPGDALRDINWRASARSRELWVSQREADRVTDVVLLLDSFVESGHDVRTVVGMAIEAALALAESHLAVTDRVGLVELGGSLSWMVPGTGPQQLQQLTDQLLSTGLHANAAERDVRLIPPRALPPRSFVVALSPLLDRRFIDALRVLRGGGHDVVVIECPPLPADFEPGDTDWARLAYRIWMLEREVTRDGLAQQGVAVAQWEHGQPLGPVLLELNHWRRGGRLTR